LGASLTSLAPLAPLAPNEPIKKGQDINFLKEGKESQASDFAFPSRIGEMRIHKWKRAFPPVPDRRIIAVQKRL